MKDEIRGYYIHGRAPWMQSDVPLGWLKSQLDNELKGKLPSRTLGIQNTQALNNLQNQQRQIQLDFATTYQIYLTTGFKKRLNQKLAQLHDMFLKQKSQLEDAVVVDGNEEMPKDPSQNLNADGKPKSNK